MNLRLFLFSLLIILVCTQCNEPEECLDIADPVCGEDGKNYFNSCKAKELGVKYTKGTCIYRKRAKVVRFDEGKNEICTWVIRIQNFIFIEDREVYFSTDKLSEDLRQDDLSVVVTYSGFSDVLYSCSSNDVENYVLEIFVLDIEIR